MRSDQRRISMYLHPFDSATIRAYLATTIRNGITFEGRAEEITRGHGALDLLADRPLLLVVVGSLGFGKSSLFRISDENGLTRDIHEPASGFTNTWPMQPVQRLLGSQIANS